MVVAVSISQNSNNNKPCVMCLIGSGSDTQKTVALAVGGFAALGFLIACFLFLKSMLKRKGEKY